MIKFLPKSMNCQRHNLATEQRLSLLLIALEIVFKVETN